MLITILEIFVIFILPVILWQFHLFPGKKTHTNKILGFLTFSSLGGLVIMSQHLSWLQLGARLDNIRSSLLPYTIFTGAAIVTIYLLARGLKKKKQNSFNMAHLLFGFTLGSIIQEFAYRGFLMIELEKLTTSFVAIIIINALIFSFAHIMYKDPLWILVITFIGGLFFASLFYFYPNIILISISHIILNFAMAQFGFFNSFSGDNSN